MSSALAREEMLLLGRDYTTFDACEVRSQAFGRTACALSPGSSAPRPKGFGGFPNEDALLAVDEGAFTLLAVSDAHYGPESSHDLLEGFRASVPAIPASPLSLYEALRGSMLQPEESYPSETTLLIAVLDRTAQVGFGLSFGDSSLCTLGLETRARRVNRKSTSYVTPCNSDSLAPRRCKEFSFRVTPGDLVLAFTDGVDECEYRSPETSIQLENLEDVLIRSGGDPQRYVDQLAALALSGINGAAGGQDNIAIIGTRV